MPDLDFKVIDAEAMLFAAAPTMLFKLHIHNAIADEQVHSIMLQTQIRIEATRRRYDAEAEGRLLEVFGEPRRSSENRGVMGGRAIGTTNLVLGRRNHRTRQARRYPPQ